MENQNADQSSETSINTSGYLMAAGLIILIVVLGAFSGSPEVTKAINIAMVVATLALGMKFGFAWVTAAAERDPCSPTIVATRPDAMQAAPVISLLEENGIQAFATGTHTSGFQVEIASDVKILVPKRDAAAAREILGKQATA